MIGMIRHPGPEGLIPDLLAGSRRGFGRLVRRRLVLLATIAVLLSAAVVAMYGQARPADGQGRFTRRSLLTATDTEIARYVLNWYTDPAEIVSGTPRVRLARRRDGRRAA